MTTKRDPIGKKRVTTIMSKDLYDSVTKLAAFNTLKKVEPRSIPAILREAISALIHHVDFKSHEIDILNTPEDAYIEALNAIHQEGELRDGVRKTYNLPNKDFEIAETFVSYNKLHGVLPKNISQLCRDALAFYLNSIEYSFHPENEKTDFDREPH